jgi:hypothetical protein
LGFIQDHGLFELAQEASGGLLWRRPAGRGLPGRRTDGLGRRLGLRWSYRIGGDR